MTTYTMENLLEQASKKRRGIAFALVDLAQKRYVHLLAIDGNRRIGPMFFAEQELGDFSSAVAQTAETMLQEQFPFAQVWRPGFFLRLHTGCEYAVVID